MVKYGWKVVRKWYSYKEERLGQGIENASNLLNENPKLLDEITQIVKKILKAPNMVVEDIKQAETESSGQVEPPTKPPSPETK